ncbi:hypothetical protein ABZS71_19060 [Streptomyces sp. NPDC005393]|uniref:baeRF10 domain-containing protein n=1 Tax=Streptomyces sp. NPDC005393 TaxID=3157041 RepID=UPI0033A478C3
MILAEQIDRIIRFDGRGLPVVSAYVGLRPEPADLVARRAHVRDVLNEHVRPLTEDKSLAHDVRMSLRDDIERIAVEVSQEQYKPGTVAAFSCSGHDFFEVVQLPRSIRDRGLVDSTPWVRPMLAVLDEYHRICVVLIDKAWARVWELYLDDIRELEKAHDRTLRKKDYARGLAEDRVRNKADEITKRHFRRAAGMLDEVFRTHDFDLLVIGGHSYEVKHFVEFLPRDLRERMAGTFDVDPSTASQGDIRAGAGPVVERYELEEQQRMVGDVLEAAAARKPAAVGLRSCLWAGSVAAIQQLLVQEGETAPGVVCDQSGWLATSGDTCPLCGEPTRQTPDVIDELVEAVIDEGGGIKHVRADTELRKHLTAASLRFPLPPEP